MTSAVMWVVINYQTTGFSSWMCNHPTLSHGLVTKVRAGSQGHMSLVYTMAGPSAMVCSNFLLHLVGLIDLLLATLSCYGQKLRV